MLVAGIFNIHHKLHYPRRCSPPPRQRQCSLCLLSPVSPASAPAVVCPPDTRARTPESWWYLAAASPPAAASLASAEVRRPAWHIGEVRGRCHRHGPGREVGVTARRPDTRTRRGRDILQPGESCSELSMGIWEAVTRIRSMTAPDI